MFELLRQVIAIVSLIICVGLLVFGVMQVGVDGALLTSGWLVDEKVILSLSLFPSLSSKRIKSSPVSAI